MKRRERQDGLALFDAVGSGDLEAARALLDRGVSPSIELRVPGWGKTTALMMAVKRKRPLLAHLLVDYGADVCYRPDEGDNAATHAIKLSWLRLESDEKEQAAETLVPKLLAKGSRPSPNCLVSAATYGDIKMVRLLLEYGLGSEILKPSDRAAGRAVDFALASSVGNQQEKSVTELLQAGANPDSLDQWNRPCINVAVANAHVTITKALIAAKANLNRHATVSIGEFREVRVTSGENRGNLIIHTPPSARDATPLIIAIRCENLEMVQLLVEGGADVNATDGDGLSPLAWSVRSKFKAAEDYLRSHDATETGLEGNPIHRLYSAAASGDVEKAREAIASGANANALVERRGVTYTPLMRAARAGHCDLLRLLLAAGADPNLAGRENFGTNITPLMLAARHGHKSAVELLLETGAKVDVRIGSIFGHRGGQNATQQAKDEGHLEIAKLLRAAAKKQSGDAEPALKN